jgi:hypothetical protein
MRNKDSVLRTFFKDSEPLGPSKAFSSLSDEHKILFDTYFSHANFPSEQLSKDPTMIVGRRGSGKTEALLSFVARDKTKFERTNLVFFEAESASGLFYSLLVKISNEISDKQPQPFAETIGKLWVLIFWACMFEKIVRNNDEDSGKQIGNLREFLASFKVQVGTDNPLNIALQIVLVLQSNYLKSEAAGVLNFFSFFPTQIDKLNAAISDAESFLRERKQRALILFDSFEQLDLDNQLNHLAISGLLMAVGQIQTSEIEIRCCIPAENYFKLLGISSNVMKDFSRTTILHWSAGELLQLAAIRFVEYIKLYHINQKEINLNDFDVTNRKGSNAFWESILPAKVTNGLNNLEENTITYLLRHTQLLPRQLISILNSILSSNIRTYGTLNVNDNKIVVNSVKTAEFQIAAEIVASYKFIWPKADEQLSATLPNIEKNILDYGDVHRIFRRSGIAGSGNVYDIYDFVSMLAELGVVGRLVETKDRYSRAIFEYSESNRLLLNPVDKLCIHPVFTEKYHVFSNPNGDRIFSPIAPIGSGYNEADRRALLNSL